MTTTVRSSLVPSYLERLGIRQQKLRRIMDIAEGGHLSNKSEEMISEHDIYSWSSSYWGRGLSWTWNRLYGGILPSLTTYPIIDRFDSSGINLFDRGVRGFQVLITSGKVHPYMRDDYGRSLLHVSTAFLRGNWTLPNDSGSSLTSPTRCLQSTIRVRIAGRPIPRWQVAIS